MTSILLKVQLPVGSSPSAHVYPTIEAMNRTKLEIDKPISLPVVRNREKLEKDDELFWFVPKKDTTAGLEPLSTAEGDEAYSTMGGEEAAFFFKKACCIRAMA